MRAIFSFMLTIFFSFSVSAEEISGIGAGNSENFHVQYYGEDGPAFYAKISWNTRPDTSFISYNNTTGAIYGDGNTTVTELNNSYSETYHASGESIHNNNQNSEIKNQDTPLESTLNTPETTVTEDNIQISLQVLEQKKELTLKTEQDTVIKNEQNTPPTILQPSELKQEIQKTKTTVQPIPTIIIKQKIDNSEAIQKKQELIQALEKEIIAQEEMFHAAAGKQQTSNFLWLFILLSLLPGIKLIFTHYFHKKTIQSFVLRKIK